MSGIKEWVGKLLVGVLENILASILLVLAPPLFVGLYAFYRSNLQTAWMVVLSVLTAINSFLVLLLLWRQRSLLKQLRQSSVEDKHEELIEKIEFDYRDPPTKHGWQVIESQDKTQPTFAHLDDGLFGRALEIRSTGRYAMDLYASQPARLGTLIEFAAKLEEGAAVYASVKVESADGSSSKNVWLKFRVGTQQPRSVGTGDSEWEMFIQPTRHIGTWSLFRVDLGDAVKSTFGEAGWRFAQLIALRVRGNLSLAYISVLKITKRTIPQLAAR